MDVVRLGTRGAIGELLLHRPEKLNALSSQMLEQLIGAASWFDQQRDVKVVVIRGAGRAFTAGADISPLGSTPTEGGDGSSRGGLDLGPRMIEAIAGMRALTIAAIHGHCIGGGVVLATACDIRYAAQGTRFSIPEVDLGIPLTWGGIPRLVRELGPALAKELVLTCRPFDAEEAQRMRLINRVVPLAQLETEAFALAEKLASQPAYSLELTKRHANAVAEEAGSTAEASREVELLLAALRDSESQQALGCYLASRAR